jgi:hypothetical protein
MGKSHRALLLALVVVSAAEGIAARPVAADDGDVPKRVSELLAVLNHPEASRERLNETVKALKELEKIGGPAAPQVVDAAIKPLASYVGDLLVRIGKPALPAIRAKWGDLNDEQRWRLMPVFEKHDRESVREYAWNCLDSQGRVRLDAWLFMLRTKDPRAEDRYFQLLETGGDDPHVRWHLLPGDKPTYEEKRENNALIDLLGPESWVAKGEGQMPPSGHVPPWWPDGRPHVIQTLHDRKVVRAAPALLRVLEEKGPGAGYLAEQIIPALADLGYKEAIPELERVAASKPEPGQRENLHPYALGGYKAVRRLAADAIGKLQPPKR